VAQQSGPKISAINQPVKLKADQPIKASYYPVSSAVQNVVIPFKMLIVD